MKDVHNCNDEKDRRNSFPRSRKNQRSHGGFRVEINVTHMLESKMAKNSESVKYSGLEAKQLRHTPHHAQPIASHSSRTETTTKLCSFFLLLKRMVNKYHTVEKSVSPRELGTWVRYPILRYTPKPTCIYTLDETTEGQTPTRHPISSCQPHAHTHTKMYTWELRRREACDEKKGQPARRRNRRRQPTFRMKHEEKKMKEVKKG